MIATPVRLLDHHDQSTIYLPLYDAQYSAKA